MWTISRVISMGILTGASIADIHSRKIPVYILISGNLMALGYQIFIGKDNIWLILGGTGIGLLFLLISRITREGMGYGDSWSILILGIYLGVWKLLEVLSTAFMLLGAAAVICLVGKKMSRKYRLPFLPFLAAGYLCSILAGGMCV